MGEKVGKMVSTAETQAKMIGAQTQTMATINEKVELRGRQLNEMMSGYRRWCDGHNNDSGIISRLVKDAEDILQKFGIFSEQVDEYLDSVGREGESRAGREGNSDDEKEDGMGDRQSQTGPGERTEPRVPPTSGKLTREAGIANREKGNRAQLHFSETVLRDASKKHDYSLKEGEPDFLFRNPDTNAPKSVGAFKALTLSEAGTRQRWIPRRKLLAEIRTATRLGLPLVLFV